MSLTVDTQISPLLSDSQVSIIFICFVAFVFLVSLIKKIYYRVRWHRRYYIIPRIRIRGITNVAMIISMSIAIILLLTFISSGLFGIFFRLLLFIYFLSSSDKKYEILETNDKRKLMTIKINKSDYREFFDFLSKYFIREFEEKPFTLQDYFMSFYKEERSFDGLSGVKGNSKEGLNKEKNNGK